jgi:hypothetical protein
VNEVQGKGLGLISTKEVPKGQLLFQEKPYVITPAYQVIGLSFDYIIAFNFFFNCSFSRPHIAAVPIKRRSPMPGNF